MSDDVIEQDDALLEVVDDEQQAEISDDNAGVTDQSPQDLESGDPVSVEITGGIYNNFKSEYGEEQAAQLQSLWGDSALENEKIIGAVIEDHPQIDELFVQYQSDNGVSIEGVAAAAEYISQKFGFESLEELSKHHPELDHIFYDHFDEPTGTLSMVGVKQALSYFGKRSGYRYTYRGP